MVLHLVTSMTAEDRQASQRDLLDVYRRALAAGGGPELDGDELWDRYRQGALYPYVAALITAGMGGMQVEDGVERSLAALEDLDTSRCCRSPCDRHPWRGAVPAGHHPLRSTSTPRHSSNRGQDVNEPAHEPSDAAEDTSTRHRILVATAEVLGRSGQTKLSLSEVALQAGVSRPTLYRWFASKQELLDAFGIFEREMFESGIARATAGLRGTDRIDAAMRFIVEYQQSYSGVRLVDIEPEVVIGRLAHIIPAMRSKLEKLLPGPNGAVKAATAIRVAVSHYIVRSDDDDQFLDQLRHAVGIKTS